MKRSSTPTPNPYVNGEPVYSIIDHIGKTYRRSQFVGAVKEMMRHSSSIAVQDCPLNSDLIVSPAHYDRHGNLIGMMPQPELWLEPGYSTRTRIKAKAAILHLPDSIDKRADNKGFPYVVLNDYMDSVLGTASCLDVLDELGRYSPYLRISVTLGGELILRPVPVDGNGNPIPDIPVDDLFSHKAQV